MANTLPNVPPQASPDQQNAVLNQVIDYLNQQQQSQVLFNTAGNPIVSINNGSKGNAGFTVYDKNGLPLALFGQYPDGSIALKVAKSGKDVTTAATGDLIFSSANNIFKIVQVGTINIPITTAGGLFQATPVAHGLGYQPAMTAFLTFTPGGPSTRAQLLPYVIDAIGGTTVTYKGSVQAAVDATYVYANASIDASVAAVVFSGAPSLPIKYYLMAETAS